MHMTNGMVNSALKELKKKFNQNKNGEGEWHVAMPVVSWADQGAGQKQGPLEGFVHIVITEIKDQGSPKYLKGYWAAGGAIVAEGAGPGGTDWGVRATRPAMIN
jgi:hypothetical protein